MTTGQGIEQRLAQGAVLGAEGYVFERERRGYIKAGPYVPEVVLDFPGAVRELHREFLRAGADRAFVGVGWRGTGYKFAPWVGRVLAELAVTRGTAYDIGRFAPGRFAADAQATGAQAGGTAA